MVAVHGFLAGRIGRETGSEVFRNRVLSDGYGWSDLTRAFFKPSGLAIHDSIRARRHDDTFSELFHSRIEGAGAGSLVSFFVLS